MEKIGRRDGLHGRFELTKNLFIAVFVAFFGMIGYLFVNLDTLPTYKIAIIIVGIVTTGGISAALWLACMKYIKQMEEL